MTALQKVVLEAKLKLKQERRSLIEDWLTVSLTFFLFISGRSVGKPLKTFYYRFVCDRIEASHMISLVSFNLYISHTRHLFSRASTECDCSTFIMTGTCWLIRERNNNSISSVRRGSSSNHHSTQWFQSASFSNIGKFTTATWQFVLGIGAGRCFQIAFSCINDLFSYLV